MEWFSFRNCSGRWFRFYPANTCHRNTEAQKEIRILGFQDFNTFTPPETRLSGGD